MKNDDAMPEVEAREWLYAPSQAFTLEELVTALQRARKEHEARCKAPYLCVDDSGTPEKWIGCNNHILLDAWSELKMLKVKEGTLIEATRAIRDAAGLDTYAIKLQVIATIGEDRAPDSLVYKLCDEIERLKDEVRNVRACELCLPNDPCKEHAGR